jgi:hypothetical protein
MDSVEADTALQHPAFKLALLHVEALAVLGLAVGRDAAVGERARLCGRRSGFSRHFRGSRQVLWRSSA